MANHFMIDLETLATSADAAILQIGIQAFDPRGDGVDPAQGVLIHVSGEASLNAGLRLDWNTVQWWLTLDDTARAGMVAGQADALLLSEALKELVAFGQKHGGWAWAHVWSNGAAFDIPILETAFRRCRRDIPWKYSKVLDVRTMKWLAPNVPKVTPDVAHDALSDCRAQALYVQRCYVELKGAPAREEEKLEPLAAAPSTLPEEPVSDNTEELAAFWDRLYRHDWTHMMSDDPGVHRRGSEEASQIASAARAGGPVYQALYEAFHAHVWKGGERPARPGK